MLVKSLNLANSLSKLADISSCLHEKMTTPCDQLVNNSLVPTGSCPPKLHKQTKMSNTLLSIEDSYKAAKTFADVCMTNVAFLEGIYEYTSYHLGPVDAETIPMLTDLKCLNALGAFTFDSQPGVNNASQTQMHTWNLQQQRAYLDFIIHEDFLPVIKKYLGPDTDAGKAVYYMFESPDVNVEIDTNIPLNTNGRFPVGRSATISTIGFHINHDVLKHIEPCVDWHEGNTSLGWYTERDDIIATLEGEGVDPEIFEHYAGVTLVARDYGANVSLTQLVLNILNGACE